MNWIETEPSNYQADLDFLKRLKKPTIYNHNSICKIDYQNLSFSSLFNCKKMNRKYSIITKIQGDLITRSIDLSCLLLSFGNIVAGKWNYQKIQLSRFADTYNHKQSNQNKGYEQGENYQIKINPISGEFYVAHHFLIEADLIKDVQKFRYKITDQCEKLGNESEKIFNTILQIIFQEEANDPYLKSDERIGVQYSKPVKISKLFKKVKKMNTLSSYYKIKQDISGQNKLKSFFQKVYLKKTQKTLSNPLMIENAVVFIPKFSNSHIKSLYANSSAKKKTQMIIPFEDLVDNITIQFARHLDENLVLDRPQAKIILPNIIDVDILEQQPGIHNIQLQNISFSVFSQQGDPLLLNHELLILSQLKLKHPSMIQYYQNQKYSTLRVTQYFQCMRLQFYLNKYSKALSLVTKLDIMAQICHLLEYLHKNDIGYFLDFEDIYVTMQGTIKIKNFTSAYSVTCWDQTKSNKSMESKIIMPNIEDYRIVCGYRGDQPGIKDKNKEQSIQKKLENQKADIFCLGMVLYRILMGKFPFHPNSISMLEGASESQVEEFLMNLWTVQTQFFLRQGGVLVKMLAQLLLKCFYMDCSKRPFIEWITVIICQIKSTLEGLY